MPRQSDAFPFHVVAVKYSSSRYVCNCHHHECIIYYWAGKWSNFTLKPVAKVVSFEPLFRELLAGVEQQGWGAALFFGFHGNPFMGKWSTNRIGEPHWIGYGGAKGDRRRRLRKHNNRTNPQGGLERPGHRGSNKAGNDSTLEKRFHLHPLNRFPFK